MNPESVALKGAVRVEDVVAGWRLVSELLRPIGFAICQHIEADVAGFTYIVYQPHAHHAGRAKYLLAGASRRHPASFDGLEDFGGVDDPACRRETEAGAVRFVIATTGPDAGMLDAERLLLLSALNVAEDARFWNPDHAAPADWAHAPAGAQGAAGRERLTG